MSQLTSILKYLEDIKNIEEYLLHYLDDCDSEELSFQDLMESFKKINIEEKRHELKLILHLISEISCYHYRSENFFYKLEKILIQLKERIKFFFSNSDIFKIFCKCKRVILFLLEEKILIMDDDEICKSFDHDEYFFPNESRLTDYDINDFIINQKIGENEKYICELIRKDSMEDFVSFMTRTNFPFNAKINTSIFETNSFLLKKFSYSSNYKNIPTLIEYAAFYGSIQIFQYLLFNNVKLPPSLWLYAIHGNNATIIHLLEDNKVNLENPSECYKYSVKCHHNDIANYIFINHIQNENNTCLHYQIKAYNFDLLSEIIPKFLDIFYNDEKATDTGFQIINDLCKCGYCSLIDFLLKNSNIDEYKVRAFFKAINNDDFEITQLILSYKDFDINSKLIHSYDSEETALNNAIYRNNTEITKLLLSHPNIDVNSRSNNYNDEEVALNIAVKKENLEVINLLLSNPNLNINNRPYKKYGKNYIPFGETALNIAVNNENIEIIKLLLSYPNIDPNSKSISYDSEQTALNIAVKKGNVEITKLLLSNQKIDVNCISTNYKKEETALIIAVENENIEIIKLLLSNPNIDVNLFPKIKVDNEFYHEGEPALHIAIKKDNLEIVKLLLSNEKIDVNCELNLYHYYMHGLTALHLAIAHQNLEICKLLLSRSDINVNSLLIIDQNNGIDDKTHKEKAPIHIAARNGNLEIMKLLLSHKEINVNSNYYLLLSSNSEKKYELHTALHLAIKYKNTDIIRLLLAIPETNVNSTYICKSEIVKDDSNPQSVLFYKENTTPLFMALQTKDLDIIKLLLSRKDIKKYCRNSISDGGTYYYDNDIKGITYYSQQKNITNLDEMISQGLKI